MHTVQSILQMAQDELRKADGFPTEFSVTHAIHLIDQALIENDIQGQAYGVLQKTIDTLCDQLIAAQEKLEDYLHAQPTPKPLSVREVFSEIYGKGCSDCGENWSQHDSDGTCKANQHKVLFGFSTDDVDALLEDKEVTPEQRAEIERRVRNMDASLVFEQIEDIIDEIMSAGTKGQDRKNYSVDQEQDRVDENNIRP